MLFPSGFPTKMPSAPLLSPTRATCTAHPILFYLITRIFGERYRSSEKLGDETIFGEQILNMCPYKPQLPVTLYFIVGGNLGSLTNLLKRNYRSIKCATSPYVPSEL
jgi:hypothetical protein